MEWVTHSSGSKKEFKVGYSFQEAEVADSATSGSIKKRTNAHRQKPRDKNLALQLKRVETIKSDFG
jgi:hypothetical protein